MDIGHLSKVANDLVAVAAAFGKGKTGKGDKGSKDKSKQKGDGKSKGDPDKDKPEYKTQPTPAERKKKCDKCSRDGHTKRTCWELHPDFKSGKPRKTEAQALAIEDSPLDVSVVSVVSGVQAGAAIQRSRVEAALLAEAVEETRFLRELLDPSPLESGKGAGTTSPAAISSSP